MPSLCVGALIATAAVAGCGDDDNDRKEGPTFGMAVEPPGTFAKRLASLLETTDAKKECGDLQQINGHSFVRFECPPAKSLSKSMANFDVVGTKEYGTGAVVDYKSGKAKDGAAIVLFVAPDRDWGISRFGLVTEPSTGTNDEDSREGFDDAVDDYLTAVRERDCDAFIKVTPKTAASKDDVCETTFEETEELAKLLKSNPSAKPAYKGGNASYGFYELETPKPKPDNSTISVIKVTDGSDVSYAVLDVAPTLTAAEQRKVRQRAKQRLEQKKQEEKGVTDMSPSSKPSDPAVKP